MKKVLFSGKWLRLVAEGHWEYAQRTGGADAVAIVPVTDDGRLVLVEQYRIPLGCRVIELPAGLVGDDEEHRGEDLAVAATRELLEETGFEAGRMDRLCFGPSSAGLSDEVIHFFHARELVRRSAGGGVPGESLTLHEPPLATIHDWLAEQAAAGRMIDYKIYVGLSFLSRPRAGNESW